jgi:hypothetical protein
MPHFPAHPENIRPPALNELELLPADSDAEPEYDDPDANRMYMILYPEDYTKHGTDMEGNAALLLNREQAVEIRDLANDIIDTIDDLDAEDTEGDDE